MKRATRFSASMMSDAKWRKFFGVVASHSEQVFSANWKLVDERGPITGGLPRSKDVWESAVDGCLNGPVTYAEIEWIELPKSVPYRPYANAPIKQTAQNLAPLRQALEATGKFPIEDTEDGFRIYGYHR